MDLSTAYFPAVAITGVTLTLLESFWPITPRPRRQRLRRIALHGGLMLLNLLLVLVMAEALGRVQAGLEGWGWSGPLRGMALLPAGVLGVLAIDLADYCMHRLKHQPLLWPMHRLHHDDREMDWTTRFRFHPLEVVVDELLRFSCAALLGVPPVALALHKVVSHVHAQMEHQNLRFPNTLERAVGWVMVTPGMHRLHHSRVLEESLSNYGFRLSIWDRLFGTLRWREDWMEVETGVDTGPGARGLREMLLDPISPASEG